MSNRHEQTSKNDIWLTILLIITTLFGLQILRVLFPLTLYVLGAKIGLSTIILGVVSLLLFATAFLVGIWQKLFSPRTMLLLAIFGIGLSRLFLQLWRGDTTPTYIVAAIGLLLWLCYLPTQRQVGFAGSGWQFSLGIATAFAIDGALLAFNQSVDLSWWPSATSLIIVVILVAVQSAAGLRLWNALKAIPLTPLRRRWYWLGIGPFLFLYFLVWQNSARVATLSGWPAESVALWLSVTQLVAIFFLFFVRKWETAHLLAGWFAGVILFISIFPAWPTGIVAPLFTSLGYVAALYLLSVSITAMASETGGKSGSLGAPHGVSMLLFVIFVFVYYAGFDLPIPIPNVALVHCGCAHPHPDRPPESCSRNSWGFPTAPCLPDFAAAAAYCHPAAGYRTCSA